MPALNYKKRFAPLVERGEKRQTIRADRKDGKNPRAGEILYHYFGMRTKGCRKLREDQCLSVENIAILPNHRVIIGVAELKAQEIKLLARDDGFNSCVEFFDFFRSVHGLPFFGKLIKW